MKNKPLVGVIDYRKIITNEEPILSWSDRLKKIITNEEQTVVGVIDYRK